MKKYGLFFVLLFMQLCGVEEKSFQEALTIAKGLITSYAQDRLICDVEYERITDGLYIAKASVYAKSLTSEEGVGFSGLYAVKLIEKLHEQIEAGSVNVTSLSHHDITVFKTIAQHLERKSLMERIEYLAELYPRPSD